MMTMKKVARTLPMVRISMQECYEVHYQKSDAGNLLQGALM
jgi:hypothetical protein